MKRGRDFSINKKIEIFVNVSEILRAIALIVLCRVDWRP